MALHVEIQDTTEYKLGLNELVDERAALIAWQKFASNAARYEPPQPRREIRRALTSPVRATYAN